MRILMMLCLWSAPRLCAQVTVEVPSLNATVGCPFSFPIWVDDTTGLGIESFVFRLHYDEAVVALTGVDADGTLGEGWLLTVNADLPGALVVSGAHVAALSGDGVLIRIEGSALALGQTDLLLDPFEFNEGEPGSIVMNGTVEVQANQAPQGTIDEPAGNLVIRPGEAVTFAGSGTDPDGHYPLSYFWDFGGGAPGSTQEDPGPVLFEDIGLFPVQLIVTDRRGFADPTPATLWIEVIDCLGVSIAPRAVVQGLSPLRLNALMACGVPEVTWYWRNLSSNDEFGTDQNPVFLDPAPVQNSLVQIAVSDTHTMASSFATAVVLVADDPLFLDFNGDGCNSPEDFLEALPFWFFSDVDADGDGTMNVADLLYINLGNGEPCPP